MEHALGTEFSKGEAEDAPRGYWPFGESELRSAGSEGVTSLGCSRPVRPSAWGGVGRVSLDESGLRTDVELGL